VVTKRKPAQQGLNRERIVAAALKLMEEGDGAEPSLRAVARKLGVTPMAIYRHIPDKQALLAAVRGSLVDGPPIRTEQALSEGEIVDAALAMVAARGLHDLNMRSLASELGVTPMALYRHVANKEALLSKMTDAVVANLPREVPTQDNWDVLFRAWAHRMWERFSQYPGLVGSFLSGPSDVVMESMRYQREILAAGGFDAHATTVALCTYHTFMLGLFRSHAYLHVLMGIDGNRLGVRGDRVRRFGDKIGLIEMIDFAVDGMISGLRASGTAHPQPQTGQSPRADTRGAREVSAPPASMPDSVSAEQ